MLDPVVTERLCLSVLSTGTTAITNLVFPFSHDNALKAELLFTNRPVEWLML